MGKQSGIGRAQSTGVPAPRKPGRAVQSARPAAGGAAEPGTAERGQSPGTNRVSPEHSHRYTQESAKKAVFDRSNTVKTKKKNL